MINAVQNCVAYVLNIARELEQPIDGAMATAEVLGYAGNITQRTTMELCGLRYSVDAVRLRSLLSDCTSS